ncbi:MAG: hypothetical protein A2231_01110 [Candidatus Firestonebacteria bacterium RIFOXYA2_FULL_40_8]|nr:MAG: hypothetical protein A2231_01110 [Candidatus Firestonebacteria bacterium RIFOXYA2_FULL_40_8]
MTKFNKIAIVFLSASMLIFTGCANNIVKKDDAPVAAPVSTASHAYCLTCGGLGLITCTFCDGYGVAGDCFHCKGTGRTSGSMRCLVCKGTGNRKCPFCKGLGIKKCPNEISEAGVTKGLSDTLRTSFFKTNKFIVLDRAKMEEIMKEQKLQLTGCTSEECAVEIGKILNVGYIVSGSVVRLGSEFVINLRFTSVETSEVVVSELVKCESEKDLVPAMEKMTTEIAIKMEKLQPNIKARSIAIIDLEVR